MKQGVFLRHLYNSSDITFYTKSGTRIGSTKFVSPTCVEYRDRDGYYIGKAREVARGEDYPYVEFLDKDNYVLGRAYVDFSIGGFRHYIEFRDRYGTVLDSVRLDEQVVEQIRGSKQPQTTDDSKKRQEQERKQKEEQDRKRKQEDERRQEEEERRRRQEEERREQVTRRDPPPGGDGDLATFGPILFWGFAYVLLFAVLATFLQEPLKQIHAEGWWLFDVMRTVCMFGIGVAALLLHLRAGRKCPAGADRWILPVLTAVSYAGLALMLHRLMLHGGFGILDGYWLDNMVWCFAPAAILGAVCGIYLLIRRNAYTHCHLAVRYAIITTAVAAVMGEVVTYFFFLYDVDVFLDLYFELTKAVITVLICVFLAKLPFRFFDWIYWRFPKGR